MADVSTEVAIATTTLGSAASSITFSSISSAYTDLRLVFTYTKDTAGSIYVAIQYNGDTASNYSITEIDGYGSGYGSSALTNQTYLSATSQTPGNATNPSFLTLDIFSYAGSTYKTSLMTNNSDNNGSGGVERSVGLWRSTSAITSVVVKSTSGASFKTGTTATLYGIL